MGARAVSWIKCNIPQMPLHENGVCFEGGMDIGDEKYPLCLLLVATSISM